MTPVLKSNDQICSPVSEFSQGGAPCTDPALFSLGIMPNSLCPVHSSPRGLCSSVQGKPSLSFSFLLCPPQQKRSQFPAFCVQESRVAYELRSPKCAVIGRSWSPDVWVCGSFRNRCLGMSQGAEQLALMQILFLCPNSL